MNQNLKHLLTQSETAQILGVTKGTLAVWRCTKRYQLSFIKIGRKVRYTLEDIEKFINKRRVIIGGEDEK